MKNLHNQFFALSAILIFSACSSVQITEEAVADQSVAGVSITSKSRLIYHFWPQNNQIRILVYMFFRYKKD